MLTFTDKRLPDSKPTFIPATPSFIQKLSNITSCFWCHHRCKQQSNKSSVCFVHLDLFLCCFLCKLSLGVNKWTRVKKEHQVFEVLHFPFWPWSSTEQSDSVCPTGSSGLSVSFSCSSSPAVTDHPDRHTDGLLSSRHSSICNVKGIKHPAAAELQETKLGEGDKGHC